MIRASYLFSYLPKHNLSILFQNNIALNSVKIYCHFKSKESTRIRKGFKSLQSQFWKPKILTNQFVMVIKQFAWRYPLSSLKEIQENQMIGKCGIKSLDVKHLF